MNKITILDAYTIDTDEEFLEELSQFGSVTGCYFDEINDASIPIGDSNIVLTDSTHITDETMSKCPDLKYIGVMATGTDAVDLVAARKRGITVTNVPSYGTNAVAQQTIALLLQITNHMAEHVNFVKSGKWADHNEYKYWDLAQIELAEKTLGIIGYGDIGKKVAEIALGFGMNVIVNTNHPIKSENAGEEGLNQNKTVNEISFLPLNEVLEKADIVSLHKPLTPTSANLIDRSALAKMKEGSILINTARGGLIDEAALYDSLKSNHLYGAGLDVMRSEPPEKTNPLLKCHNCIITPHIAFAGEAALRKLRRIVLSNLEEFYRK